MILDTIKSRGYWRINFQPLIYTQKLLLRDCFEIVKNNTVELRGWDYPHFPLRKDKQSDIYPGNNFYEAWIDWGAHKEFWRMYQSGQFIHYLALPDDWINEDFLYNRTSDMPEQESYLSIRSAVYAVTEILEFAARLCRTGVFDEGFNFSLHLEGMKNRFLWVGSDRLPLLQECRANTKSVLFEKIYNKNEVIVSVPETALEVIIYIFERFDWRVPNKDMIRSDQTSLYRIKGGR